jgi:L-fuconolactonase
VDAHEKNISIVRTMNGGIDAHQHFWKFDPVRDSWIDASMAEIQRDFSPADLKPMLVANGLAGSVVVQSDQSEAENVFQLANAEKNDFVKGVVGWVDFQAENIHDRLSHYSQFKKMKGFRHVLQGEKQRDYMLRPAFKKGIAELHSFGYSYDILIFPDQLSFTYEFVKSFPYQPFVIDHIAKPYIKAKKIDQWKKDMQALGKYENLSCKVSGMVTEADWKNWKKDDFKPYLDVVLETFGTRRLMFGSDWPVCLVAASYADVVNIFHDYFSALSKDENEALFKGNAERFYKL